MARVLVCDDDLDIVRALEAVLVKLGHEVTVCIDGLDAIALLDAQQFEAVITDWQLGAVDGLNVLSVARARCPLARRVMVTASPTEPEVREAVREGLAQVLLEKPWSLAEVRAAVRGI